MSEQTTTNPYIFGDPALDRLRLASQTTLLSRYISSHACAFFGDAVSSILDVGSASGTIGLDLLAVYPAARLTGIDRDAAAISEAQQAAAQRNLAAQFVVGDVQTDLPNGPYDLALCSLVLVHTTNPQQVLQSIYNQLNHGGILFVIDLSPDLPNLPNYGPEYQRLSSLLYTTLSRIGVHPYIMNELPMLVAEVGFVDYQRRERPDDHPMLTHNATERTLATAAGIGAMYNARMGIAAATGTPLVEIERLVARVVNLWTASPGLDGPPPFQVATAVKP